ncbi:hypothetical protein [Erythrobacter sp. SG61-1L]|uniref:hypothetical protein n=1 Tax=Erythrobacter sp. SG61-1L TaxID=1603897 RepID=UPI000AA054A2|nr:hypothetical protein [Erythrobacter sp. SG61-1L]
MKWASVALLAVIAICVVLFTYDHFFGGSYAWVTNGDSPVVIKGGYSYWDCPGRDAEASHCVKER